MTSYPPLLLTSLNLAIATASIFILIAAILLLIDGYFHKGKHFDKFLDKLAWPLIIFMTVGSLVMSLLYSEYFGFIPCSLCWLQRIAIYPQALMSIMAYKLEDTLNFPKYGIGLSIFGLGVAIYQYVYQMLPHGEEGSGVLPCLTDGSGADCALKVIDEFGFVTFPFVSAVTFLLLIALYLYVLRANKSNPLTDMLFNRN